MTDIILTTTPSVDGKTITEYLGIVGESSSAVDGTTRSTKGVDGALAGIQGQAQNLGADAVVGIQFVGPTAFYHDTIHIYGTAVKLK